MSGPPPIPPRPVDYNPEYDSYDNKPPPIPPLPLGYRPDHDNDDLYNSATSPGSSNWSAVSPGAEIGRYNSPLLAPRPTKVVHDLGGEIARTLDQVSQYQSTPVSSVQMPTANTGPWLPHPLNPRPNPNMNGQQSINENPGFVVPNAHAHARNRSTSNNYNGNVSTSQYAQASAGRSASWTIPMPQGLGNDGDMGLVPSMAGMKLGAGSPKQGLPASPRLNSSNQQNAEISNGTYNNPGTTRRSPPLMRSPHQSHSRSPDLTQPVPSAKTLGAPLVVPRPSITSLSASLSAVFSDTPVPDDRVQWCREVVELVQRIHAAEGVFANGGSTGSGRVGPSGDTSAGSAVSGGAYGPDLVQGPARISNPALQRLVDAAVQVLTAFVSEASSSSNAPKLPKLPSHLATALYLYATLASSGLLPALVPPNPRQAFRDFERAARNGVAEGWFRLGRDYESFRDEKRAKECFERGVKAGDARCLYRMGMAHLLAQLGLPASPTAALPLLHRAALFSTPSFPHPAYIYALLLLNDLTHISPSLSLSPALFSPLIPTDSSSELEARVFLEMAARSGYGPAVYRLARAWECAEEPCEYDAVASVRWYAEAAGTRARGLVDAALGYGGPNALAELDTIDLSNPNSASDDSDPSACSVSPGEWTHESEMALSKWFLCGAEHTFSKNERLARYFALRAAKKGLASGMFAMGYYCEVGVGGGTDVEGAVGWYEEAVKAGNEEAPGRLAALHQAKANALSRSEHEKLTENKLVRRRTQAKEKSDAREKERRAGAGVGPGAGIGGDDGHRRLVKPPHQQTGSIPSVPVASMPSPGQGQLQQPQRPYPSSPPYPNQTGSPKHANQLLPVPGQGPSAGRSGRSPSPNPGPLPYPQQNQHPQSQPQLRDQRSQQFGAGQNTNANPPKHGRGYSLTDAPGPAPTSDSAGGRLSPNSGGRGRQNRIPSPSGLSGNVVNADDIAQGPAHGGARKYQTFAEMGIQSGKAEDKECSIM